MPEIDPRIPHRFLKERTRPNDTEPRTYFTVHGGFIEDRRVFIHGYDVKNATHEHVLETVRRAKERWKYLTEKGNGWTPNRDAVRTMENEFPYIDESHSLSNWLHSATQFSVYGIRELKECLSKHLAAKVSKNNIEFGSGAYMYTPSVCVDLCEEALLRNPADVRLLFDLNKISRTTRLPFEDHCFDSATMPIMMSYIADWKPFLGEVFRILKPGASGFILLWENAGGTVVHEDGVSTWYQRGPRPDLSSYADKLKELGYAHTTRRIYTPDGRDVGFKLIEVSPKRHSPVVRKKEDRKQNGASLKSEVLEFHRKLLAKGIDASFIFLPWEPWENAGKRGRNESVQVLVFFHHEPGMETELHARTISEFKEFLLEKKGAVQFYTGRHEVFDPELMLQDKMSVLKAHEKDIDQLVYNVRYDVLLNSRVICGKAAELKEQIFTRLLEKVDTYMLYKALLFAEEKKLQGNGEIIERSEEFDRTHPGAREEITKNPGLVLQLWKRTNIVEVEDPEQLLLPLVEEIHL